MAAVRQGHHGLGGTDSANYGMLGLGAVAGLLSPSSQQPPPPNHSSPGKSMRTTATAGLPPSPGRPDVPFGSAASAAAAALDPAVAPMAMAPPPSPGPVAWDWYTVFIQRDRSNSSGMQFDGASGVRVTSVDGESARAAGVREGSLLYPVADVPLRDVDGLSHLDLSNLAN